MLEEMAITHEDGSILRVRNQAKAQLLIFDDFNVVEPVQGA